MRANERWRRIAAHYIHTPRGPLRHGVITLDEGGTIRDVSTHERIDSLAGVEFYSGMLIPGMVNAHTHLELSFVGGAIPPGTGFAGFAAALAERRRACGADEIGAAAALRDAQMYAEGVSAVGDVSNGDSTFALKARSAIHYHTFIEVYGLGGAVFRDTERLAGECSRMGLAAGVTPHSAYSLNDAEFRAAVAYTPEQPLSIHFMESAAEGELFEGRGEMRRWYDSTGFRTDFTDRYPSPAARIAGSIPADRRIMLVHNTLITRGDVEMLRARFGDRLTFVLCPRSNRHITGLRSPVAMLGASGCRIAVGTDSMASNADLSMIAELKMFPEVPLPDLVEWATGGGAAALGMDDRLGTIAVGRRPGIALVEAFDMDNMRILPATTARRIV